MNKFFDYKDIDHKYNYRVLVYPNITYQKDLDKDSYVVVIREVLRILTAKYPYVYWVLLLPEYVDSLKFPHVEQRILKLPTYPNTMRTHFNALEFSDIVKWKDEDIDLVYSHLPEHTSQLSNFFYNATNLRPNIVGYSHWFEFDENTSYEKRMLLANLAGILEMSECGVNTNWLKNLVLDYATDILSEATVDKLDRIIKPHYLGVEKTDKSDSYVYKGYDPSMLNIVFNHRLNDYTGWNWLVPVLDEMWSKRQDFRVYTTLGSINKPWNVKIEAPSRVRYLETLSDMDVGLGCFETYSAWSISTTDGLSESVPYILPNRLCYPEMVPSNYPLLYNSRTDFVQLLEKVMNDRTFLSESRSKLSSIVDGMFWEGRVSSWFGGWDNIFTPNFYKDLTRETEAYLRIKDFIKARGRTTKSEIMKNLSWGKGIPWSPYRNKLRKDPDITFIKEGYKYG